MDLNGDGHLDIIAGNFEGSFYLFEGVGAGKFTPSPSKIMIENGNSPLVVSGHHSDPFVVDWDGDGDLDLLSGSGSGGVYWAQNTAKSGESPNLSAFASLVKPPGNEKKLSKSGELPTGPGGSTRVWADDLNGDGKMDLSVGDNVTLTYPADGLSEEDFEKKQSEWNQALTEMQKKLSTPPEDKKERDQFFRAYKEHYQSREDFVKEERTGLVWILLQS